jgi:hypothetical protein
MVGDRVPSPSHCHVAHHSGVSEGSTPLLFGPSMGHPGDGRRTTSSLCPCGACSLAVPLSGTLSLITQQNDG